MSHTNEPLEQYVDSVDGCCRIATKNEDIGLIYNPDDARRIVACVNACAGISTDVLELGRVSPDAFRLAESRADKAEQQRDELLAALEKAAALIRQMAEDSDGDYEDAEEFEGVVAGIKGLN